MPSQCKESTATFGLFLSCFFICVSVLSVYLQVQSFDFLNFDDNIYISSNPFVLAGINTESISWAFSTTEGGHWHPLSWLSHMLDIELFGVNPGALHLVNLGFHLVNSLLLFSLVYLLLKQNQIALLAAIIFALHPLRIESVAWISQRKDLLSLGFGLSTCILYIKYYSSRRLIIYAASLISFILALLAKPSMMSLPILLIILELAFDIFNKNKLKNFFSISKNLNKVPFFCLSIICSLIAVCSQSNGGGLRSLNEFSISDRINIAFPAYIAYLGKLFWPLNASIYYPINNYPSGLAFGCFIALAIISLALYKYRETAPEFILAWLWFLVALVPMVGFITIGAQAFADRWTQLAHIGPIVGLLNWAYRKYRRHVKYICLPILIYLSFLTHQELRYWRNSETVFRRALQIDQNNFMAHTNLGAVLNLPEKFQEQAFHYEEAVRLNPTYPEALNNLGIVRAKQGHRVEAVFLFEKALSINPNLNAAKQNLNQVKREMYENGE